ncbi:MAG TPA: phosphoribosylamine--glycine ligase [Methanococcaceae archaeon]|uniref:Phosphoribosylamine--glycine ligase n=1 Tax=Methanothermococcus okinawensis TaxID=155863 RepID=A0A832ZK54_9EURY|nr:phosphoribosylamine--glycine ligase [Methanococcaceae archaeon]HIP90972.1 phosphoribosylamine--glycine ligase [Methanothermococcus okinawensis]
MKVLLIGGGAREHAIAEALKKNPSVKLYTVMKNRNPGIYRLSEKVSLKPETDIEAIKAFVKEVNPDIAVIGPEAPLGAGVADVLWDMGVATVGPRKEAAQIETSKEFMRELMKKYRIKGSVEYASFDSYDSIEEYIDSLSERGIDVVVKPVGLTGGKGVKVVGEQLKDNEEAKRYARDILEKNIGGGKVVIEEKLVGVEFTLHGFVDGKNIAFTPPVQDHPHAYEGDEGPITGGMGSYSCPDHKLPFLSDRDLEEAREIMRETVEAIRKEVGPYQGILYGQFMLTVDGPKVVEYNARFGDPEAMNILPLLKNDFLEVCEAIVRGNLDRINLEFERKASVCKYVVPRGYPTDPVKGKVIRINEEKIRETGALLYYASVDERDNKLYLTGSRSVALVGISESIEECERIVEEGVKYIEGDVFHRRDIGKRELIKKRIEMMRKLREEQKNKKEG